MVSATAEWRRMLREVVARGDEVSPDSAGADFKGRTSRELLGFQTVVPMSAPVVACPTRALGYRFMAAEAAWILSGDNRLSTIAPYARSIRRFSDDGLFLSGAYGPPFVDQLPYVVSALRRDLATRQAVLMIWRPRPAASADVPCTVALQWLARRGKLECAATMRSSDAITGWPYDVHTFSEMSAAVALSVRGAGGPALALGDLRLTVGSQHVYKLDYDIAEASARRDDEAFTVAQVDLSEFRGMDDLIAHLWSIAERRPLERRWLAELPT